MSGWATLDENKKCVEAGRGIGGPSGSMTLQKGVEPRDVIGKIYNENENAWIEDDQEEDDADEIAAMVAEEERKHLSEAVNAERARRLAVGTDVEIPGYGWVALQGREEDQRTLQGLNQAALGSFVMQAPAQPFYFNDRNNVLHQLTAGQIMKLFALGSSFVASVYEASWIIKAMPNPPEDVETSDIWPKSVTKPSSEPDEENFDEKPLQEEEGEST